MDIETLEQALPAVMDAYPTFRWSSHLAPGPGTRLIVDISSVVDPARAARLTVLGGAEVFLSDVLGHSLGDFCYDDAERVGTLEDCVSDVVAALSGPTRIELDKAGDSVVWSRMSIGSDPARVTTSSVAFRRTRARLRGVTIDRTVLELAALV